MKLLRCCAPLLAMACIQTLAPAFSQAAFVDGAVTGPGGFGSSGVFIGAGSNLAEPGLTFTSVNYLDVSLVVDSGGTYQVSETPAFGNVHNTTGQPWVGFTWDIISGPGVTLLYQPGSPQFSSIDFSNTFANATGTATFATYAGGTLADGGFMQPNFYMLVAGPGTIVIRETPITVPEPGSLALLSIGALAIVYGWARKRARAA